MHQNLVDSDNQYEKYFKTDKYNWYNKIRFPLNTFKVTSVPECIVQVKVQVSPQL